MTKLDGLQWGTPAPWFRAPALDGNPNYAFDSVAGRHVIMLFFGSTRFEKSVEALKLVARNSEILDDVRACFFGVTVDVNDATTGAIKQQVPGIRHFLDYDRAISTLFGAADDVRYRPQWVVLDPQLRVLGTFDVDQGDKAFATLRSCIDATLGQRDWAPVLLVPRIFEEGLCRKLINQYHRHGGEVSGFMREVGGKTVHQIDPNHKVRRDFNIEEPQLRNALASLIRTRLIPQIERSFQFKATRIERHIVACYEAGAGHFRAHRDNTTKGTAHRRFAVTINLNAEEYEGGNLRFPEYGNREYRAPTGGAIVFSCSLLHEAMPVTRGKRYAFLPFLYDEAAARAREANNRNLGEGIEEYRA